MNRRYATHVIEGLGEGRIRFHVPKRMTGLIESFRDTVAILAAPRAAPTIYEVEDAIIVNRHQCRCLYDRDGRRIDASRLVRYADDPEPRPWACEPQLPSTRVDETIHEPVVYRGLYFKQWGHFLIESLSRLWTDAGRPDLAALRSVFSLVWGETKFEGRYAECLELLGVNALPDPTPGARVRLAKVYIPSPTFVIGTFCHPLHLETPRRIARKLLSAPARDDRPVYLSRTDPGLINHKFRRLVNEPELEAALAARGVRIVHMQHLSLAEQIELTNTHRVFIGPFGSAFHNLLFSLDGREIATFVLTTGWLPRDFVLIDALIGNHAHYLVVLGQAASEEATRDVVIDIDATLDYLMDNGVI